MSDFLHVPVLIFIEKPMFSIEAEILFAIDIPELQIDVYSLLIREKNEVALLILTYVHGGRGATLNILQ